MINQILIITLVGATLLLYLILIKLKNQKSQADTDTTRPSAEYMPRDENPNDKLAIVTGVSNAELHAVLNGLCNMYNKETFRVLPRLFILGEKEFAITFPFDIDFEMLCYFINYVHYPMDFERSVNITGWTTTKTDDFRIGERLANKKVMLFVPLDDTEYDNVYMTTAENTGYKIGFADSKEGWLLDKPRTQYAFPSINILELDGKEYTDYK